MLAWTQSHYNGATIRVGAAGNRCVSGLASLSPGFSSNEEVGGGGQAPLSGDSVPSVGPLAR